MGQRNSLILSVDDAMGISEVLRRLLTKATGAEFEYCPDNDSALSSISLRRPDLVISDMVRPGGSGLELFTSLRGDPKTVDIPFVFVTGQITRDPSLELELFRAGADGVFPKPWHTDEFLACVKRILRKPQSPDIDLLLLGFESRDLDYKEAIELDSRLGRASFAKDALAMANIGGGSIVVGVREEPIGVFQLTGLADDQLAVVEATRLNDALRRYIGATISITSRVLEYQSRRFAILKVPSSGDTLALAAQSHEGADLFTGRVYARTDAARTEEVRDSLELLRLIDRIVTERERRSLKER